MFDTEIAREIIRPIHIRDTFIENYRLLYITQLNPPEKYWMHTMMQMREMQEYEACIMTKYWANMGKMI